MTCKSLRESDDNFNNDPDFLISKSKLSKWYQSNKFSSMTFLIICLWNINAELSMTTRKQTIIYIYIYIYIYGGVRVDDALFLNLLWMPKTQWLHYRFLNISEL